MRKSISPSVIPPQILVQTKTQDRHRLNEEKDRWPSLPAVTEVHAPMVGDIESCHMSVRVGSPGHPLFVELDQKPIGYLIAVVQQQIDSGEIHRQRSADQDGTRVIVPEGFSWASKRKRLVKKKVWYDPAEQRKKSKTEFFVPERLPMSDDGRSGDSDDPGESDDSPSSDHDDDHNDEPVVAQTTSGSGLVDDSPNEAIVSS